MEVQGRTPHGTVQPGHRCLESTSKDVLQQGTRAACKQRGEKVQNWGTWITLSHSNKPVQQEERVHSRALKKGAVKINIGISHTSLFPEGCSLEAHVDKLGKGREEKESSDEGED